MTSPSPLDELFADAGTHLTVEEVADLLSIKRATAYAWLAKGTIPGYKVGSSWVILSAEVKALIANGRNDAEAPPP